MSGPRFGSGPPPRLSVVVIVHDMVPQAMNTLLSLSPGYQEGVTAADYEVVVVENRSARTLDPAAVAALGPNIRYTLRDEPGVSPAAAIDEGVAQARAPAIGLMIDGARLVTPGVVRGALQALAITPDALVAVPGYEVGAGPQHLNPHGTPEADRRLLAEAGWPGRPYAAFAAATISHANRGGFLRPFMECNCLFMPADILREIGRDNRRFDLPGGGALNLYLWHRAANHPRTTLFVLPGEGSFHQSHGGVTTSARADREALLRRVLAQLVDVLGEPFHAPDIEPILLGRVPLEAHRHLTFSAERLARHAGRVEHDRAERAAQRAAARAARGAPSADAPALSPAAKESEP